MYINVSIAVSFVQNIYGLLLRSQKKCTNDTCMFVPHIRTDLGSYNFRKQTLVFICILILMCRILLVNKGRKSGMYSHKAINIAITLLNIYLWYSFSFIKQNKKYIDQ